MNLEHLRNTLIKGPMNKGDKEWILAFKEYNLKNEIKIGMGCRSCYYKVFKFIESELNMKSL